ncbi:hypothetical protein Btru_036676, partial [Bulinus truncatus]
QYGFQANFTREINNQSATNVSAADQSLKLTASSSRIEDLDLRCLRLEVPGSYGSKFAEAVVPVSNITRLFEFMYVDVHLETIDVDTECVEGTKIGNSLIYGVNYTGLVNVTASGFPCQPWQNVTPHNHTYNDIYSTSFPDPDFADAQNFCRNPKKSGAYRERPWCFTVNTSVPWEYCSARECSRFTVMVDVTVLNISGQTCGQYSFYTVQSASKIRLQCPASPTLFVCDAVGYGVDYQGKCGEPHHQRGWNLTGNISYYAGAEAEYVCAKGYHHIQGDGKIVCQGTRAWSSPTLVCSDEPNHALTNRTTLEPIQDNDSGTCAVTSTSKSVEVNLDYTVEVRQVAVMFAGKQVAVMFAGKQVAVMSAGKHVALLLAGKRTVMKFAGKLVALMLTDTPPSNVTVTAYISGNSTRLCRGVTATSYGFLLTCAAYPVTNRIVLTYGPDIPTSLCEVKVFGRKYTGVLECRQTESGAEYKGHQNISTQGFACSSWADINRPEFTDYEFPDGNITDVKNYCRNPILKSTNEPLKNYRPICFYRFVIATTVITGYDYCDLFSCEKGCRTSKDGSEYTGKINRAVTTGTTDGSCMAWNTGAFNFRWKSDFSDSASSNYCRNPGKSQERPWCYLNTTSLTYAYCDIPMCPTAENTGHLRLDLNNTSDLAALKSITAQFRECLLTEFYQASYSQPIYDAIMYILCSDNTSKHRDLLCHYPSNNTNASDYGDKALWMRVHIICPSVSLTTTSVMTSVSVTSSTLWQTTSSASQTSTLTAAATTDNETITSSMCPMTCSIRCPPTANYTVEIKVYQEQIRHELLVNTNNLSKTIRTKNSAPDPRPTAKVTAGVAVAIMVVIIVCLLSGDVVSLSFYFYLKIKGRNIGR